MKDDQLVKLFKHMEAGFKRVDARFDEVDRRFDVVLSILDGTRGKTDTLELEQAAANAQLTRHEHWIQRVSAKVAVPYRPHS